MMRTVALIMLLACGSLAAPSTGAPPSSTTTTATATTTTATTTAATITTTTTTSTTSITSTTSTTSTTPVTVQCVVDPDANPALCAALHGVCPMDLQYYTDAAAQYGLGDERVADCARALCCFCDGGESTHPSCTAAVDFGGDVGRRTVNDVCIAAVEEADLVLGCEEQSGDDTEGSGEGPGSGDAAHKQRGDLCECDGDWWWWRGWGHHESDKDDVEMEEGGDDRRRHSRYHHGGHHRHHDGEERKGLHGYIDGHGECDCGYDAKVHVWALTGMVLTGVVSLLLLCCCCRRCRRKCRERKERCSAANSRQGGYRCRHRCGGRQEHGVFASNLAFNMDAAKVTNTLPPVYAVDSKLAEATLA